MNEPIDFKNLASRLAGLSRLREELNRERRRLVPVVELSWECGACGRSGRVECDTEITIEAALSALADSHGAVSPSCAWEQARAVFKIL